MRIGKKFEIDNEDIFVIMVGIVLIVFLLTSCAYPLQSKVIKPRSEAKANFR